MEARVFRPALVTLNGSDTIDGYSNGEHVAFTTEQMTGRVRLTTYNAGGQVRYSFGFEDACTIVPDRNRPDGGYTLRPVKHTCATHPEFPDDVYNESLYVMPLGSGWQVYVDDCAPLVELALQTYQDEYHDPTMVLPLGVEDIIRYGFRLDGTQGATLQLGILIDGLTAIKEALEKRDR